MAELEDAGALVWAITGDEPARLRQFRDAEKIQFSILLDPEGDTFRRYGILNERHDRTVPHPTVIVVDAQGVARYLVSNENHKVRPPTSGVVAAVRELSDATDRK